MLAAMRPKGVPYPDLGEVRWSSDYQYVYLSVISDVERCGFHAGPGRKPVEVTKNHIIYHHSNPGAASLLGAIHDVLTGSTSIEASTSQSP